jgi:hypothetical protein
LRLLLLLSALIAGMTGLIAGPAAAREPAAIAAALAGGSEQARPAAEVRRPADDFATALAASFTPVLYDQVLAPQSHPVSERRNE